MIIKTKQDEFLSFLSDASNYKGHCERVLVPASAAEIAETLDEASQKHILTTVAGNGTGLTGGRCPDGGQVLATSGLNRIIDIDPERGTADVECGVLLADLQTALRAQGMFYAPDPTEQNCCIGATIATNASGAKSFGYGPTRSHVQEIEVVLPAGTTVTLRRGEIFATGYRLDLPAAGRTLSLPLPRYTMPATKNAAGYYTKPDMDAIDLFIGAEGTLGVITRARLAVLPLPQRIVSGVAFFDSEDSALTFIENARSQGGGGLLRPRALEFFDSYSLAFLHADYPRLPAGAAAAVWFEQECTPETEEPVLGAWLECIEQSTNLADDTWYAAEASDREAIRQFRHAISAKVNDYISKNNFRKLGTDTAVPHQHFREFYNRARRLADQTQLEYVAYGHFGDSHLHLNLLPQTEGELYIGKSLYTEICKMAVGYGGTVSAEHGIGKAKKEYLELMYGVHGIAEMRQVKKLLDPAMILNIGNMFSPA